MPPEPGAVSTVPAAPAAAPVVLVCGEALVDVLIDTAPPPGSPVATARILPGGSPFNLAVGLSRLGCPAAFLGGISSDASGALLERALRTAGVDTTYLLRTDRPTPRAWVARDPAGHPRYTFQVTGTADTVLTPDTLPGSLPPHIRAIALGSYPVSVAPMADALATLAARESAHRVLSLDANLRPALAGDLAQWRERFTALVRHAALVKASDEDLAIAYGPGCDMVAIAQGWLRSGASLAVVTLGAGGALACSSAGNVTAPGRPVQVIDTVGAGDSFHAALLARLWQRGLLDRTSLQSLDAAALGDVVHYAVTASSITCSRPGADPPSRADMIAAGDD